MSLNNISIRIRKKHAMKITCWIHEFDNLVLKSITLVILVNAFIHHTNRVKSKYLNLNDEWNSKQNINLQS